MVPGTGFVEDSFSMNGGGGGEGSGGNASDGERWGTADEASLARRPLTSRYAARFLTGRGSAPVRGPAAGDPCSTGKI